MASRLDRITDWETRSRKAHYCVTRVARSVRITPRHLERYFVQTFACHPKEWMEDLRLLAVHRALQRGELAKEIALRFGFTCVTHLSRAIRMRYGINLTTLRALPMSRVMALAKHVAKWSQMSQNGHSFLLR